MDGEMADHYLHKMIAACEVAERAPMDVLPTAFRSAVIDDCLTIGSPDVSPESIEALRSETTSD